MSLLNSAYQTRKSANLFIKIRNISSDFHLTVVMEVKWEYTSHGHRMLLDEDNYQYNFNLNSSGTSYFRCIRRRQGCPCFAIVDEKRNIVTEVRNFHNHLNERHKTFAVQMERIFINAAARRSTYSVAEVYQEIYDALADSGVPGAVSAMRSKNALARCISRKRQLLRCRNVKKVFVLLYLRSNHHLYDNFYQTPCYCQVLD